MINHTKVRWIFLGFCWMAVVYLTFWNLNKIESIQNKTEKKEIYRMDEQFWKYNAANISQILQKSAALIQEVESPKLGLFEFENRIRSLASTSGLKAIKLSSQSQFEQDGIAPVDVSFQSTFRQAAKWFDLLESELPYARVEGVHIELDQETRQNKFSINMHYRYRQSAENPL